MSDRPSPYPRAAIVLLALLCTACGNLFQEILDPARDLTGRWVGSPPTGALYQDNVSNPNCRYQGELVLDLVQSGSQVAGNLTLTVRKSQKLLQTSLPCLPAGVSGTQALIGEASVTNIHFTLADGTEFDGSFTSDIMKGNFASLGPNGIAGTWNVLRQ